MDWQKEERIQCHHVLMRRSDLSTSEEPFVHVIPYIIHTYDGIHLLGIYFGRFKEVAVTGKMKIDFIISL